MIKINLALKKTSAVAGEGAGGDAKPGLAGLMQRMGLGGGGGGGGASQPMGLDDLKDLPIKRIAILIVTGLGASYALDAYKENETKLVDEQVQSVQAKQASLKKKLDATKGYDEIKKQIEADETTIRTKIETIQKLVADRQTPPKMMLALSTSIPEEVWIQEFKITNEDVALRGYSSNFNQVSDFMAKLKESAYFKDPQLKNTTQGKDDVGQDAALFELSAKRWGKVE